MNVELLHSSPLWVCSTAIRKCWASEDKSDSDRYFDGSGNECYYMGTKDLELIHRVGNKNKHSSTLEHLVYTFDIDGISRACLQELARHRHASMSVKSTRYTLKELKKEFMADYDTINSSHFDKYLVRTGNEAVDNAVDEILFEMLETYTADDIANDIAKFMLPEAYKTSLVWTINARSLQNFLELRTNKSALWEIRKLAYEVYSKLPDEHKYLFTEFIYKEKEQ